MTSPLHSGHDKRQAELFMGGGSRPRWERDRDVSRDHFPSAVSTDTREISSMSSGWGGHSVDRQPAQALACARFPTIHRPNYYFNWINNINGSSSGESEK